MAYCIVIQTLNKTETGVYHLWETIAPPPWLRAWHSATCDTCSKSLGEITRNRNMAKKHPTTSSDRQIIVLV